MNTDYAVYKNRLIDYLHIKGIECAEGQNVRCFIPGHSAMTGKNDDSYSCTVNAEYVFCHACKQHGDIYDAVEWLDGITEKKEQYSHLAGVFGGSIASSPVVPAPEQPKRKKKKKLDAAALEQSRSYMSGNPRIADIVRDFFKQREKIKGGKYPDEVVEKLLSSFLYWPGLDIARHDLPNATMLGAGIPYAPSPTTGNYTWGRAGVVIPLAKGFKLHYCTSKKCEKFNSKYAEGFPVPQPIDTTQPVILVEGELDALVARAAGIENVYSTGSITGLTKEMIETYLLGAKEVVFLYDNDEAGRGAMGAIPNISASGNQLQTVPDKLRKYGYTGSIKLALLEIYKDADECVRQNRVDLIHKALQEAKEYVAPEKVRGSKKAKKAKLEDVPANPEAPAAPQCGTMTEKELASVLKQEKIQLKCLDKRDVQPFVSACSNAVAEWNDAVRGLLEKWGAPAALLKTRGGTRPSFMITVAEKYGLTYYFINKIRRATLTRDELAQLAASPDKPIVTIDFSKVKKHKDFNNFVNKHGNKSAANLCAFVLGNKLVYSEEAGCFYRFNGHVWEREPDPWGVVYNILASILNYFINHNADGEFESKDLYSALVAIEKRSFRNDVVKDLSVLPTVWHEKIQFDGVGIKETLTLLDGVIDFTGSKDRKLHFRTSSPKEFRMQMLPYRIDDVKNAGMPEKFLEFMHGNFKNDDTLEMLNQFISLIPSRCATYKVAGIFVGRTHTGKTTTLNILRDIYSYYQGKGGDAAMAGQKESMLVPLPVQKIMLRGRLGYAVNGPDPFMEQLIGAGAAVCDETDKNDKIDSAVFKSYTGGGALTVRGMWKKPENYEATAQLIISTNYSPKFDSSDTALVERMVIVPFSIQHDPDEKDAKDGKFFMEELRPEYPAIIKYYAEKYLKVKYEQHGKIKISQEAEKYKGDYVQKAATPLNSFVDSCIEFIKDDTKFVRLKDVYKAFIQFSGAELDEDGKPKDRDVMTQSKFTRYFKGDYNEVVIGQKKFPGHTVPEQIVLNCVLRDIPSGGPRQDLPPAHNDEIPFDAAPDEDPFAGPDTEDTDEPDIF